MPHKPYMSVMDLLLVVGYTGDVGPRGTRYGLAAANAYDKTKAPKVEDVLKQLKDHCMKYNLMKIAGGTDGMVREFKKIGGRVTLQALKY